MEPYIFYSQNIIHLFFFFSIRAFLINSDETPHKVDGFAGLSHSCIFLNPNNNAINLFIKKKKKHQTQ